MEVVRKQAQHGWIEVITGSMFSGKSEELIRRLRRVQIASVLVMYSAIASSCGIGSNGFPRKS